MARLSTGTVITWLQSVDMLYKVIAVMVIMGAGLVAWARTLSSMPQTVQTLPAKIDSLRIAHDSQTTIMRRMDKSLRCLVYLNVDRPAALGRCALEEP